MTKLSTSETESLAFLSGGGEMGRLIRSMDWSQTPLGSAESWPQSLRTTVSLGLASNFPMCIAWGPQHVMIYNDGYWPVCGGKHPRSMGQDFSKCWASAWPVIGEPFALALAGQASFIENQRMFLDRNGYLEETFFTFSFSPIRDETGGVGGVLNPCHETTARMLSERRMRALRDLAARAGKARSVDEVLTLSAQTLADYDLDLPFVLMYARDDSGQKARLVASTGLKAGTGACPDALDLDESPRSLWPVAEVFRSGSANQVDDIGQRLGPPPYGPYPEPPKTALLLPIMPPGAEHPAVVLVAGVSPRLPLNEAYRDFFDLLAAGMTAAIGNARAYEEERKRVAALAEIDRAKTTFFSNVSHEFRTPLTLILGPLEDVLAETTERSQRERLELLHRNALRLQKLVNTLLDFSRIEADRLQASYEPTELAELTAELASGFRSAVEKAGMRLIVHCPPLDEPIHVDRDMYEKIVLNLLSNAFKFTLAGEIEVALRNAEATVELSVRDTGTGIAEEQLPHIFERFHRIEGALARTHEGTGIGLALVQELVRLHGGTVEVRSVSGQGSTFTVSLPKGKAHLPADRIEATRRLASTALAADHYLEEALSWLPDAADAPTLRHSPLPADMHPSEADGPRPRIVWADDNADMRNYVSRLLGSHYEVEAVPDGEAALAAVRRQPPDLILTDVMMPRLDGFGLLRALRADPGTRSLPVIMLSARAGAESRVEGMEAGADDYLTKPFSARELLARVGAHLEMARLRRESEQAVRESEARFRHMADHSPIMVWVTEQDGSCSYLSKSWYELTGQTPTTGLGLGWIDAVHPDDRARARDSFLAANARREAFRLEYRLRRKDGQYRWAMDAAAPRIAADGTMLGYIGSVIDITERQQAEEALRDANRRKDEFLAMLAHELRNPLAPLCNAVHILRLSDGDGDTLLALSDMLERQVGQMVRLVDDLLDASRITRGRIELRKQRVELAPVVNQAVEAARSLIQQMEHELTITLPSEPLYLDADSTRLAQVIGNLLSNACKFMDRRGRIALAVERQGEQAVLQLRDEGIGIAADKIPNIFDMFMQADNSLERAQSGLGIGLTLVKNLVEMHGGAVSVHSKGLGQGSEFVVRLPLLAQSFNPPQKPGVGERKASASRRILIVDDNHDAAQSLAMMLRLTGHQTQTASDGLEAIEAAERFQPEVVLLDIGLPKLNGYDACRHIRGQAWGKNILLVAVTGWGQSEDRARSQEAGFDHHLVKPVDLDTLAKLLAARVGGLG